MLRFTLAGLICTSVSACSVTWLDPDGKTHFLGFGHVTMDADPQPDQVAGQVISTRTLGVSVFKLENNFGVGVGYTKNGSGYLRNNSLVYGGLFNAP